MKRVRPSPVAHYYDRNTRRFLRFAARGAGATIHRAVWAPGVGSRNEAVNYVHELLLQLLQAPAATSGSRPVVWDLGCGIGASMRYLAERQRGCYAGVTISASQILLAQRLQPSTAGELHFLQGDFCDATTFDRLHAVSIAAPSLVYLIESFGHATDPRPLLTHSAASLAPEGLMAICDDFPASEAARERPEVRQFAAGWRISSFWTPAEIAAALAPYGLRLVENRDLTSFVELNRVRDRLIARIVGLPDLLGSVGTRIAATPFWGNMRGGTALQRGLKEGSIHYRMLVFGRR